MLWCGKYSQEGSGRSKYSDKDYDLFPRYIVLREILEGVESLVEQYFSSLDDCKAELKLIGLTSNSKFTADGQNSIKNNAIQDERNKFVTFINNITNSDLDQVEPLPYRRKMNIDEAKQIRQQLFKIWKYDSYWDPLDDCSPKPTVFLMQANVTDDDIERILEAVKERANNRIFWINEDHVDYEIEIDSFDPTKLYETICCDNNFDWVIYGSHESTITFGGTWLIEIVKQLFSDREDKLNLWERTW